RSRILLDDVLQIHDGRIVRAPPGVVNSGVVELLGELVPELLDVRRRGASLLRARIVLRNRLAVQDRRDRVLLVELGVRGEVVVRLARPEAGLEGELVKRE